jgi:polyisoprenoid-binding protein YceI
MSPDFFAVDSFPTAQFTITSVSGNTATGDMTIRGHKSTETVKNIVLTVDSTSITATGDLTFDRQKYDVSWESPMKDMVLSNDIVLKIQLKGKAK